MRLRRVVLVPAMTATLAVGGLSACGFDMGTNRPYAQGAGDNVQGDVSVLNAVIVSSAPGEGNLVASINNGTTEPVTFDSVAGDEENGLSGSPNGVEIAPNQSLNLAEAPLPVTGTFTSGEVLAVTLSFSNGDNVAMDVPVVDDAGDFEGLGESGSTGDSDTETTTE